MTQVKNKFIKVWMVCSELEPRAAGWKAQTNPLSYGDTPYYGSLITAKFRLQHEPFRFGHLLFDESKLCTSVTSKKSPNVCKSYPKMISPEKLKILTHLQKLLKNVGDLGKVNVA